jgi:hypothetical protein
VIIIPDKSRKTEKKTKDSRKKNKEGIQYAGQYSMTGKSPEEMLPYLLSGESDDSFAES